MTSEFAIALHALVFLSKKGPVQSSEAIAESVCTNAAVIRRVLAKLQKKEIIDKKEGQKGGYSLSREPEKILLRDILIAVNAIPVSVARRTGERETECSIACGMADIMDDIYTRMNRSCVESLSKSTVKDIIDEIVLDQFN